MTDTGKRPDHPFMKLFDFLYEGDPNYNRESYQASLLESEAEEEQRKVSKSAKRKNKGADQ